MNGTSSTPSTTPIPNNYGVATSMADVQNQINEMEAFFETGATLPVDFRLRQLRRLQAYCLPTSRKPWMPSMPTWENPPSSRTPLSWGSFTTRFAFT